VIDPLSDPLSAVTLPPTIGVTGERWALERRVITVGPALGGREQRVASPLVVWRASLTLECAQRDAEDWEALLDRHAGGRTPALLGPLLSRFPSRGGFGAAAAFSDGTVFSDGFGFVEGGGPVVLASAAGRGRRWLELTGVDLAERAKAGRYLSIHARMFRATSVRARNADTVRVEIEPALPWRALAGQRLDALPRARMRIVRADEGGPARRGRGPRLSWTTDWVETPARTGRGGDLGALRTVWR